MHIRAIFVFRKVETFCVSSLILHTHFAPAFYFGLLAFFCESFKCTFSTYFPIFPFPNEEASAVASLSPFIFPHKMKLNHSSEQMYLVFCNLSTRFVRVFFLNDTFKASLG